MSITGEPEWRAWQPGDGLQCSESRSASAGIPCGPPVLLRIGRSRRVLCENHLASQFLRGGLGRANAEAEKQARETVLMNHWDEYQIELKQRRAEALAEALAAVPASFRPMVEKGLAAHEAETAVH